MPGRPEWVRDEPRVAVVAEIDTPRGRLHVACTHLSFLSWWNGAQLRLLMRGLGDPAEPLVLLGDLNMGRRRAERITRLRTLESGLTFPSRHPIEQIDHILASDGLRSSTGGPVEMPMSDHRALVADVEWAT
jgi:endonuclease/exonuclease/phosphatase family metal-dependent hydrolase